MSVAEMPTSAAASSSTAAARPLAVQSYLSFEGRCEEALAFYREALGARIGMMMRFKDAPPSACTGGNEGCGPGPATPPPADKIMHASFHIGATELYATDGMCNRSGAKFSGIALSLPCPDEAAADRAFNALADGGQIQMPMATTFFATRFGMVADRFGVTWMVIVPAEMG